MSVDSGMYCLVIAFGSVSIMLARAITLSLLPGFRSMRLCGWGMALLFSSVSLTFWPTFTERAFLSYISGLAASGCRTISVTSSARTTVFRRTVAQTVARRERIM